MDCVMDLVQLFGTVVLADDHTGAGGQAHEETDEHIDNGSYRSYGGVSLVADIIADDPGVDGVVELLKNIADEQRKGKRNQMTQNITLGHIHILATFGG